MLGFPTYRNNLGLGVERLLPHHHEAVREVENEENNSTSGSSNVGSAGENLHYL